MTRQTQVVQKIGWKRACRGEGERWCKCGLFTRRESCTAGKQREENGKKGGGGGGELQGAVGGFVVMVS